jgi:hypothetical protein
MTCLFFFCKQTKDEYVSGNKKEEMDYDGEYDNGDAETFDHGYDHKYDGYDSDGGKTDDIFDFL